MPLCGQKYIGNLEKHSLKCIRNYICEMYFYFLHTISILDIGARSSFQIQFRNILAND